MTPRRSIPLSFALLALLRVPAWPAPLDSAAAVRALSPAAAAEARPARLRGHLLLVTAPGNALVLHDRAEGIYVELERVVRDEFRPGDELEVEGATDAGDFAPIIRAREVTRLGPGALPPPRPATIAELNAGGLDAAWVELRGIVRACVPTPPERRPVARVRATGTAPNAPPGLAESWLVTFAQGDDLMEAQIHGPVSPAELVDAEVRVRAVVFNVHNANRQFVRANLQVPGRALVEVLVAPPADPFAAPALPLGEVLRFSPRGFSGHRVHVRGVVAGHKDRRTLWLTEGGRGMQVASAQQGGLAPGDVVEVAGFPVHGGYTPGLSDAIFRKVASGPPPAAEWLRSPEDIARRDASLVQVRAELREVRDTPEGLLLALKWEGLDVLARLLQSPDGAVPAGWEPGAIVRVTGICQTGQANFLRPTGLWVAEDLQLWLRTPADLAVLAPAPWLTTRRALWLATAVALATLLALVVQAVFNRRQLAQREEERKLAEAEFSAMLAERNRLARELHDTLAQELNSVSMQLELAKNSAKAAGAEPALPFLAAAHAIVRQCIAEARESIWDMRSHILEKQDLAGALRSVAEQLRGGVACDIRAAVRGRPRRLAPAVENNLLRIGQEAVSNALKHARPAAIDLELEFGPAAVRLAVVNDGREFDPAGLDDPARHFGLRGMRERVAQMHGALRVGRDPDGRTRVEVSVETPGAI